MDALSGHPVGHSRRLVVGIADVMPKLVVHRLIEPALHLDENIRVVCHEGSQEELLAELAIDRLDVVLSDAPIPPTVKVRAHNHLLGECAVVFMASPRLASKYRRGFPRSLDSAPVLLPADGTVLRHSLEQWFSVQGVHPVVVGEFDDSALLKVFGQAGTGVFAVPAVIEQEVARQFNAKRLGTIDGVTERFYAISRERKIRHAAVAAICEVARSEVFAVS